MPLSDNLRSGDDFQKSLVAEGVDFRVFPILRGLVPAVAELDNALPKAFSATQFGEPTLAHPERRGPAPSPGEVEGAGSPTGQMRRCGPIVSAPGVQVDDSEQGALESVLWTPAQSKGNC